MLPFLPLGNTMMPDGGAAHRLPSFEQRCSREFKFRTKYQFPNIRKPDTNSLEYRVGVTVEDEQDQKRTNSR
jgi:hypothetical protein